MLNKCCFTLVRYFNRSYERNRVQKENISTFRTRIRFIFFLVKSFSANICMFGFILFVYSCEFQRMCLLFCLLFFCTLPSFCIYSTSDARRNPRRWNIFTWIVCIPSWTVVIHYTPLARTSQGTRLWLTEDMTKLKCHQLAPNWITDGTSKFRTIFLQHILVVNLPPWRFVTE
jgi:hypothetical protein